MNHPANTPKTNPIKPKTKPILTSQLPIKAKTNPISLSSFKWKLQLTSDPQKTYSKAGFARGSAAIAGKNSNDF